MLRDTREDKPTFLECENAFRTYKVKYPIIANGAVTVYCDIVWDHCGVLVDADHGAEYTVVFF